MNSSKKLYVEKQIIKPTHKYYNQLDELCLLSKNLYNTTLYRARQYYFENNSRFSAYDFIREFTKENQKDFRALPAIVSRYVIQLVEKNMNSYFKLVKLKQKGEFTKKVKLPNYLNKKIGRQIVHYHKQALSLQEAGKVKLSKSDIVLNTAVPLKDIQYLQVVPCGNHIKVLISYYKTKPAQKKSGKRFASIDVGVNNLMTVTSNAFHPIIYNGKPMKSVNQFFNKTRAKEVARLKKENNVTSSKKLGELSLWRENQISNYFHKATSDFVRICKENKIDTVVIGRNKGWKTNLNIGSRNNQQFKMIPFLLMYNMLSYKLEMAGINYIETEESYTSKCSFIDKEKLTHHDSYAGRRIKRGLFKSKDGHKYNADVNGSLNILRKYLTNQNAYSDKLHKELLAHMTNPKRITV